MTSIPRTNIKNVVAMDIYYDTRVAKVYYSRNPTPEDSRRVYTQEYLDVSEANFFVFQGAVEKQARCTFVEVGSKRGDPLRHFQRSDLVSLPPNTT